MDVHTKITEGQLGMEETRELYKKPSTNVQNKEKLYKQERCPLQCPAWKNPVGQGSRRQGGSKRPS